MEVGGYPVSMARLIAGAAAGKPFAEPEKVVGVAHLGQSGVDEWASALLQFPVALSPKSPAASRFNQDNMLRILGTNGRIEEYQLGLPAATQTSGQARSTSMQGDANDDQRQRNAPPLFLRG